MESITPKKTPSSIEKKPQLPETTAAGKFAGKSVTQEPTEQTARAKRTDSTISSESSDIMHSLNELKENCSRMQKAKGFNKLSFESLAQEHFKVIQKRFEEYQKNGILIAIPKDILELFEPVGSGRLPKSPADLQEEQVERLRNLIVEGELRSRVKLKDYGQFGHKDLVNLVAGTLKEEDPEGKKAVKEFAATSTSFREALARGQILPLTGEDLRDLRGRSEKLQFAKESNLPLKITLNSFQDFAMISEFINNPENADFLKRVEILDMSAIPYPDMLREQDPLTQDLINRIGGACPNLSVLGLGEVRRVLTFSKEFKNLTSFFCEKTEYDLNFSSELLKLESFSCKLITYAGSRGTFPSTINFAKGCNLKSFSCDRLGHNATLNLQELKNLESLIISSTMFGTKLNLPDELPDLKHIEVDSSSIYAFDADTREKLKNLKAKVDAKAAGKETS